MLGCDLMCYFVLCAHFFEWPSDGFLHISTLAQYSVGVLLSVFALWSKRDAYRVIGTFAWYWGDFFFLVPQELQFDRVFGIAPHPMYTLGYFFFYGMSLLCNSYTVFLVSLVAHACQLTFLLLVENPHIEKTCTCARARALRSVVSPPPRADNTAIAGEAEAQKAEKIAAERGYLRRDLIVFKNFNMYRSSDVFAAMLVGVCACLLFTNLDYKYFCTAAVSACCCRASRAPTRGWTAPRRTA